MLKRLALFILGFITGGVFFAYINGLTFYIVEEEKPYKSEDNTVNLNAENLSLDSHDS